MAHDVSRALMWLFTFSLNLAQKTLKIPTRYNCTYKPRDILRALTFLSLEAEYAEGGLKNLSKKLRRANQQRKNQHRKDNNMPGGDTLLLRLEQINRQKAKSMLSKLNRQVLSAAKTKGAFRKKIIVAIDLTYIPYYGKKLTQWVVGGKTKKGTSYFHCWATLRIVSSGRRFTIKARPVKRDELDAEAMAKIVLELLAEAKTCAVHINLVLRDKVFCCREVISALKASRYKFRVAAKRDKQVREAILDYFRTGKGRFESSAEVRAKGRLPLICLFTGSRNAVAGGCGTFWSFMGLSRRTWGLGRRCGFGVGFRRIIVGGGALRRGIGWTAVLGLRQPARMKDCGLFIMSTWFSLRTCGRCITWARRSARVLALTR